MLKLRLLSTSPSRCPLSYRPKQKKEDRGTHAHSLVLFMHWEMQLIALRELKQHFLQINILVLGYFQASVRWYHTQMNSFLFVSQTKLLPRYVWGKVP